MTRVDLNCDLGEGAGRDAGLMPWITSANIACGAHAGDENTMRELVTLATLHGVAVGAHPGFADREFFGRREMAMAPSDLRQLIRKQILSLRGMGSVRHVKPHGGLYNLAARDRATADIIADTVWSIDPSLKLFALSGSELVRAGRARGLVVAEEVFGDRTYQKDGSLTPRSDPRASIDDEREMVAHVLRMLRTGRVRALDGTDVRIAADTICLHGDGSRAVTLVQVLRRELEAAGVAVEVFGKP